MAALPSPEQTAEHIIEIIKSMNVRAGEIAPMMAIQQKLGAGFRADDLNAAFEHMQAKGLIEPARNGFIKLTQAGYGNEPATDEIARAFLDEVGSYGVRPGEVVPANGIAPKLMQRGYKGEEISDAMAHLVTQGLLEIRNGKPFLTEAGFGEI